MEQLRSSEPHQDGQLSPEGKVDSKRPGNITYSPLSRQSSDTQRAYGASESRPNPAYLSNKKSLATGWWLWELVSMVFSILCIVAIIIVLKHVDAKPLADWTLPIQPNTLVAIFATLAKAAMLLPVGECISQLKWLYFSNQRPLSHLETFDCTSRGGSFAALTFLGQIHVTSVLGSLGAAIMVLSLAVSPFVQQVISYPSRDVPLARNTSSLSVAQTYDSGAKLNVALLQDGRFTDSIMQGAITSGLYNIDLPSPFVCPSSYCVWDSPFVNLGVSNVCKNVTVDAIRNCTKRDPMQTLMPQTCNYTTPNGVILFAESYRMSARQVNTLLNVTLQEGSQGRGNESRTDFFFRAAFYRSPEASHGAIDSQPYEIIECTLSYVAKSYASASVHDNNLQYTSSTDLILNKGSMDGPLWRFNVSDASALPNSTQNLFTTNIADTEAMYNFLESLLAKTTATSEGIAQSGMVASVLMDGKFGQIFDNIAVAMTNRIQRGQNATQVNGVTYGDITYVQVRWEWLSLPILVLVCAVVLLACTMVQNGRQALWKSSSLALLFHAIPEDIRSQVTAKSPSSLGDLSKRAELALAKDGSLRFQ